MKRTKRTGLIRQDEQGRTDRTTRASKTRECKRSCFSKALFLIVNVQLAAAALQSLQR